jgi:hypothetical protein
MATEYHLTCIPCKEFINIYKLRFVDTISPLGFDGIEVTKAQIQNEVTKLKNENSHHWIKDILPLIETFLIQHDGHKLVLFDDLGDHLWDPEFPGYCDWKEITSSLVTELFLPRNLIDDLKITNWNEAESYLLTLKIFLYEELELTEYKRKFIELVNKQNSP